MKINFKNEETARELATHELLAACCGWLQILAVGQQELLQATAQGVMLRAATISMVAHPDIECRTECTTETVEFAYKTSASAELVAEAAFNEARLYHAADPLQPPTKRESKVVYVDDAKAAAADKAMSLEDVLHRLAAACGLTPETTDAAIDKMKAELEQLHSSNRQQ